MGKWLLLVYKVPREPSATRVYVWRKLKQLGALALQDAVWALPYTPRTREHFQWLAAEISELGGDATYWSADAIYATDPEALKRQFTEQVDEGYAELLAALKRRDADLTAISLQYQKLHEQDYFQSQMGEQVRKALLPAHRGKRR